MFRVGDQVKLSAMGRGRYADTPYNPHNEIGIVEDNIHFPREGMSYNVRWPSGEVNIYRRRDLELVHPVTSLEQMLKECLE
jgi:hypothetical protein